MEIIIEKPKKTDVIYLDDIDQNKHIVVGIDDVGRPIYFTPLEFTENDLWKTFRTANIVLKVFV